MNRLIKYLLLSLIVATNCVTPFDFEAEEGGTYFVVSGGINQLDEINRVKLTFSTKYGSNTNAQTINDAEVFLVNSKSEREPFYPEEEGVYAHYGEDIKIEIGESYYIEILLNGKMYSSDPQIIPTPIYADSVSHRVAYRSDVNELGNEISYENIDIFISTPINQNTEKTYLRWKADEAWMFTEKRCSPLAPPSTCYMRAQLEKERIFIFSSESISGNYLEMKLVAQKRVLDRVEFIEKHYFNVDQYTLTKDAYEYWEKVVQLANPSGDIFDLPPAPLPGNVYNVDDDSEIVLGYFDVAAKVTVRKPLYQDDILPLTITSKDYLCQSWNSNYTQICCNCRLLPNSSYNRPDYW